MNFKTELKIRELLNCFAILVKGIVINLAFFKLNQWKDIYRFLKYVEKAI